MPTVNVMINGKNYRMACDDGQEAHLEKLAAKFDKYIDHLKSSFGEIGDQRLTVMAGVMVTDEMEEMRAKIEALEEEVNDLKENRAIQSREKQAGDDDLAKGIIEAAKKIEQLNSRLTGTTS